MWTSNCSDAFKRHAVDQMTVREVLQRLSVSTHSLRKWMKLFGEPASNANEIDHEAESRRLKRELARMTDERDTAKTATACFARAYK